MKRSFSWPELNTLEEDDDADLLSAEVVIETLQQNLSDFEIQARSSRSYIETLNLEKADLQMLNMKLIENNRLASQQIFNLEDEKYRLVSQLKKAENLIEVLQQDLEKADRAKSAISKDLGIQQQVLEIMDNAKKEAEKHMEMFREATARDRNLIESKALEDLRFLTNQLEALELQLKERKEAVQQAETFSIENKKLLVKNKELIKQNVGLERQLNKLQELLQLQKEQNQLLRQEIGDMILQNSRNISLNAMRYEPPSIKVTTPTTASNFSTLTSYRDRTTTNPPRVFFGDQDDVTSVAYWNLEDEEQWDPVAQYIRLSVKAVKIHFPNLTVSNEILIEKAKMVPFYKVHDILSSYMQKLENKESFQNEWWKQQPLFVSKRPSIFGKLLSFFTCGVMSEESQKYQCNALRQRRLRKEHRGGIRVGF